MRLQTCLCPQILEQPPHGQVPSGFDNGYGLIDNGIVDSQVMPSLVTHRKWEYRC